LLKCGDVQMRTMKTGASLVVVLLLSTHFISTCLAHLRIGAFNGDVFGQSKVGNQDVLNILVKVFD